MLDIFSKKERIELAGTARTIEERMAGLQRSDTADGSPEIFKAWIDRFPDQESFYTRLAQDGWDESDARRAVGSTELPAEQEVPEWVTRLERLLADLQSPPEWILDLIDTEAPFARVFAAVAGHANRCLGGTDTALRAARSAVPWLVTRLRTVSIRPLYVEFESYLEHFDPERVEMDPSAVEDPPTAHYERFVGALFDDGLRSVYLEYPVLARLTATIVDNWVAWINELCRRLAADRDRLERTFEVGGDPESFEPLSTDTHGHGRVPVRVRFETGSVVYKPRSVKAYRAFKNTIDSVNDHLSVPTLPVLSVADRGNYGWMEWADSGSFESKSGAEAYYRRAGVLLCLAYVTNATDLQFENLIAARSGPVTVDAETVCHADCGPNGQLDVTAARTSVQRSVLRTGLLPVSVGEATPEEAPAFSVAGFGECAGPVQAKGYERPEVIAPNTDLMSVKQTTPTVDKHHATPTGDDTVYPPSDFRPVLMEGFKRCYDQIQTLFKRDELLGAAVDLSTFEKAETRYLFRPSTNYQSVLERAVSARALSDGAWFSVEIESLAASLFTEDVDHDRYWSLYTAERAALRRFDVPRITTTPHETSVSHDGKCLNTTLPASGIDRVHERLSNLSSEDKIRQLDIIKQCYKSSKQTESAEVPTHSATGLSHNYTAVASRLFDSVRAAAIETNRGRRWVETVPRSETLHARSTGVSLYRGRAGIGITAAALSVATGCEQLHNWAVTVLSETVRQTMAQVDTLPLGAGHGAGSVVYAGSLAANLLDEDDLYRDVKELINHICRDQISNSSTLGVLSGVAGTLLSSLAHYKRFGGQQALAVARQCGDRLLAEHRQRDAESTLTGEGIGLAHGDSGVAHALARLADQTQNRQFETAAKEVFDTVAHRLSSLNDDQRRWWCRGRPGVAVAFTNGATALDTVTAPDWVTSQVAERMSLAPLDHVCCGNAGRIATVLAVTRALDTQVTTARDLAELVLQRRAEAGSLSLPGHGDELTNPTFFDGVTGVVYALLRLDHPDTLPSIVALQ